MNQITEIMARSLSLEELAQRLRDHDDPAIRVFAEKVIAGLDGIELAEELEQFLR